MHTTATLSSVDAVLNDFMDIGRHLRRRMTNEGLDPGTYWMLQTIDAKGTLRVTELAACAGLDASTVSRHVAQLERSGAVTRTPDPDDGRAQRLTLTDEGAALFRRAQERRRSVLADSLDDWTPSEIDQLHHLLGRIAGGMSADLDARTHTEENAR